MSLEDSGSIQNPLTNDLHSKANIKREIQTPYIAEALCELHFRPIRKPETKEATQETSWEPKWFGKMLQQLGDEYDLEPALVKMTQIISSPNKKPEVSKTQSSLNRMIYKHTDGIHLFQLSPGVLSINEVGSYPGWTTFSTHIETAWSTFSTVVSDFEVTRIGLRYINRIPRSNEAEKVGHWLSNKAWLPPRLEEQKNEFFFRFDAKINEHKRLKLTVIEEQSTLPVAPLIFDLDVIIFNLALNSWAEISKEINNLHTTIRDEFDESLTEHYQKFISSSN